MVFIQLFFDRGQVHFLIGNLKLLTMERLLLRGESIRDFLVVQGLLRVSSVDGGCCGGAFEC